MASDGVPFLPVATLARRRTSFPNHSARGRAWGGGGGVNAANCAIGAVLPATIVLWRLQFWVPCANNDSSFASSLLELRLKSGITRPILAAKIGVSLGPPRRNIQHRTLDHRVTGDSFGVGSCVFSVRCSPISSLCNRPNTSSANLKIEAGLDAHTELSPRPAACSREQDISISLA